MERSGSPPSPPPVILLTHEFYPYPGGIAVYAREVALALAAEGRDVTVWCPPGADGGETLAQAARGWPFRVVPIPGNGGKQGWLDRLATLRLWRARAAELRAAHLLVAEPGALRAASLARLLGFPCPARLSVMLHGSEILYLTRPPHRRWLLARLLARAEVVGVVSRFCRGLLLKHVRVAPAKIRVAHGALRSDLAVPETRSAPTGGHAGPPLLPHPVPLRILCAARIHPRKGQLELLRAVAALPAPLLARVHVCFAGRCVRPKYRAALDAFARRHQIQHEFTGELDAPALARLYAGADLFALTSLYHPRSFESFGLVYLEAGAFGLPVLALDTGGVSDAVRDGETGLLAPAAPASALASALRRLLEDPALRRRLGDAGRAHARSFTWRASALALAPPA